MKDFFATLDAKTIIEVIIAIIGAGTLTFIIKKITNSSKSKIKVKGNGNITSGRDINVGGDFKNEK